MQGATTRASGLKQKAAHEAQRFVVIAAFLALFFCAFSTYRSLILHETTGILYFHYGYALLEALIVAKVIMLGDMLKLGERDAHKPLIVPTLYKAAVYSVFVMAFIVLEKIIEGLLHGEGARSALEKLMNLGWDEILARTLVVFVVFIAFFALEETGRVLGEGKLLDLFFRRKAP